MQIKKLYNTVLRQVIKKKDGASLVTSFVLLFIVIMGITGIMYTSLYSYSFSNKSVDFNEMYYELDDYGQMLVQAYDQELYKIEQNVIEYMQSEGYAQESVNESLLDEETHQFFHKRWKEEVYSKSQVAGSGSSTNSIDPVKYNELLDIFYEKAFEKLYYNRIYYHSVYGGGDSIAAKAIDAVMKTIPTNQVNSVNNQYNFDIQTVYGKNHSYGMLNESKTWESFEPTVKDLGLTLVAQDKDAGKTLEIKLNILCPKYASTKREINIEAKVNPLTAYGIISSKKISTTSGNNIEVSGDMYAYKGLEIKTSTIDHYGNFYTPSKLFFNNSGNSYSRYKVHNYKSNYKGKLKGLLHASEHDSSSKYNDFSTGNYIEYTTFKKLNSTKPIISNAHFKWAFAQVLEYSPENKASMIFPDSKGGNVYCAQVSTNNMDANNPNIILDGGTFTSKTDHTAPLSGRVHISSSPAEDGSIVSDLIIDDRHSKSQDGRLIYDSLKIVEDEFNLLNDRAKRAEAYYLGCGENCQSKKEYDENLYNPSYVKPAHKHGYYHCPLRSALENISTAVSDLYFDSKYNNGGYHLLRAKYGHVKSTVFDSFENFVDVSKLSEVIVNDYVQVYDDSTNTLEFGKNGLGNVVNAIIYSNGDLTIKGDGTINGAVIADGNVIIDGDVTINHAETLIYDAYIHSSDPEGKLAEFLKAGASKGKKILDKNITIVNARARTVVNEERFDVYQWILK
ncbi:DUF2572 family protein [Fusibacter sp. JL216-2]|uniref:DUF2572 family protein n=1 Tax=Fusibacter sp. JL216-2 TaxID=3071453 RepID=UPI003D33C7FD